MFTKLKLERLYVGSIYQLVFVGLSCSLFPAGVAFGLLAMFGFNTVSWNGQPVHGLAGLLLGPALGVIMTLTLAVLEGEVHVTVGEKRRDHP